MNQPSLHSRPAPRDMLRHYWRVAGVRPWHLVLPFVLVLIAGAFEAGSFALLLQITKAVGQNTFGFFADSRALRWISQLVPESSASRNAILTVITVGLIILGRAGKFLFEYLRNLYIVPRTEGYRVAVGTDTFARVLGFGRQYFERQSIGHSDAEISLSSAVIRLLTGAEEALRYVILLLVKVGVMIAISLPLSIAFALTLPFVSAFIRAIDKRVERIAATGIEADRRVRSRILDILGSIPLVKAYSQEGTAAEAYGDALSQFRDVIVRRERVVNLRYPLEELAVLLVMLTVQGTVMFWTDNFTPGDLARFGAFLFVVQQSLPDYRYLSMFSLQIAEEWPRLEAITQLYSDEGKFIVPSGPRVFVKLERAIALRGVSFQYDGGVNALTDIHATIEAGKVTAIVGRTGAGKTTLADLLARFYDCAPGTLLLDGVDIREYSLPTLQARMALVSQHVWLLNRTLRDNLTFGLPRSVSDAELHTALADVDLHEFAVGLREGLDTEIGDHGVRLSGGQRQRVALARALLRDPDILILDEATSALDSVVEQRVARAIHQRAAGRTLIMIAHRLSTIRDADLILVMHDGRVAEQGTWDELLRQGGRFRALHDAQYVPAA
ncbi:MAG: ABC transporter ATP-binding protein [Gemmatimonadaceae bacterium]